MIAIENTRLLNELRKSLQQQTATSDVLKVISRSTFDLQTVLDTLVESAARLCDADNGHIARPSESGFFQSQANYGFSKELKDELERTPFRAGRDSVISRALLERAPVHILDAQADPEYKLTRAQKLGGYRTMVGVPLLREGTPIGVFGLARYSVKPFTAKQIEMVETFADQAVIAIENVRLFEAEQQRSRELAELLDQQTVTSEVLQVISSSPGDLQPVFATMLANMVRVCNATHGSVYRFDGDAFRFIAQHNTLPVHAELTRYSPFRPGPKHYFARMIATKTVDHVADLAAEQGYLERRPEYVTAVELGRARTALFVPMLKENKLIGVFAMARQEVRPFNDKQIELVQNFAAQAVIAIENTRLLNELRQRTDDLSESLEQQTATSEILEVISNSPTNTQPAFDAIVRSGLNLFPDAVVAISLPDRDLVKLAAIGGADEAGLEALRGRYPMPLSHEFITGTAILDRREIDLADAHEPPKELTVGAQNLLTGGYCAMAVMPMMRGDETMGALNVIRRHQGPLSDKQRELLRTFANQAVIAIENTRLFNELRESLQQQTATADVLKVISRSTFDLQTVLNTLTESAARLCAADKGLIFQQDGDVFRLAANYGFSREAEQYAAENPFQPNRGSVTGRALLEGRAVHVPDVLADPEYGAFARGYQRVFGRLRVHV